MSSALELPPGRSYIGQTWSGTPDPVRAGLALLGGLAAYVFVVWTVAQAVMFVGWAVVGGGRTWAEYYAAGAAFEHPVGMLAANLGIACLALVSFVVVRLVFGLSATHLITVANRIRWGYLGVVTVIAAVVFIAFIAITQHPQLAQVKPQPQFAAFMLVAVITSPLQAAAEEIFFRGLLLIAIGAVTGNRWVGAVASALIFALFHGTQSLPLFLDRFCFGLLAALLVVATGGLEAGIAAHVANNLLAFVTAGLFSTIATARTMTTVDWTTAIGDVAVFAAIAALAWWLSRRWHLQTVTEKPATPGLAKRPRVR